MEAWEGSEVENLESGYWKVEIVEKNLKERKINEWANWEIMCQESESENQRVDVLKNE
jgi:DNA-binding sugar fermentation-stimulating protein